MTARLLLMFVALLCAGSAQAAIKVAENAASPALRIDAAGNAEVSWKERGVRKYLLVPKSGRVLPGGRLSGHDVSKPTSTVKIPFKRVLRRTPDGSLWALQAWQVVKGGPVDLRFSRWKGAPTGVTAEAECCANDGETLSGAAAYQGMPIFGSSPTTGGIRVKIFVYVDCFGCLGAAGWQRLTAIPPRAPDGSYSLFVRPAWLADRYRAILAGPNLGWAYTPDALAEAATGRADPL
jgi:hypothetical protein